MPHSAGGGDGQTVTVVRNGGRAAEGGTSEASLVSNKRGDQTCSLPVKENIILENGRTG